MLGYRMDGVAPIIDESEELTGGHISSFFVNHSVDPLPQALVLTAIVISLGSLALIVSICIRTYEKYGTFDITEIRRLKG